MIVQNKIICDECHSPTVELTGGNFLSDNEVAVECDCGNCGRHWTEHTEWEEAA